jgi:hypothetical protein
VISRTTTLIATISKTFMLYKMLPFLTATLSVNMPSVVLLLVVAPLKLLMRKSELIGQKKQKKKFGTPKSLKIHACSILLE